MKKPTFNTKNYYATADLMKLLKVSKNWIYENLKDYFYEKNEIDESIMIKAHNTVWYKKDSVHDYVLEKMEAYTKDFENNNARKRGDDIPTVMPESLKFEIKNGFYKYPTMKELMITRPCPCQSNETVYRDLFEMRAFTLKLNGKTYFYIPFNDEKS